MEDLANLLGTSLSMVKRDDAYLMKEGITLLTRGWVEDIGRGVSHKTKAKDVQTIARITRMGPSLVKEYLEIIRTYYPVCIHLNIARRCI